MDDLTVRMWRHEIARVMGQQSRWDGIMRIHELRQIATNAMPMRDQRLRDKKPPTDTIKIGSAWQRRGGLLRAMAREREREG